MSIIDTDLEYTCLVCGAPLKCTFAEVLNGSAKELCDDCLASFKPKPHADFGERKRTWARE